MILLDPGLRRGDDIGRILTFYGFIKFEVVVKSQNSDVPPGRGHCRHRYRELIDCLFDPDTDSGPDADKAEMVFSTISPNS